MRTYKISTLVARYEAANAARLEATTRAQEARAEERMDKATDQAAAQGMLTEYLEALGIEGGKY